MHTMRTTRPVWAEIDLSAIRRNIVALRGLLPAATRFCAVVKADAYGHGAEMVARTAVEAGADFLAVAILDEALHLRGAGFELPILILGYTPPEQADVVVAAGLRQTVFAMDQAVALSAAAARAGKEAVLHIKIDTGMGRLGVRPDEAGEFAAAVAALPGVDVEGAFTHFACADHADKASANRQFALFLRALESIAGRGVRLRIRHCANSAAIVDMPGTHLDMVRAGIAQYGLHPSGETSRVVELCPAMRLRARVVMVKDVAAGVPLGYGGAYVTGRRSVVATMPLGYADGWFRGLGNRGRVLFDAGFALMVGRVCMDQFLVDVTGLGVCEGDEALLFGGVGLPVEEVADLVGTINYEVVCAVGKRVPRVYV